MAYSQDSRTVTDDWSIRPISSNEMEDCHLDISDCPGEIHTAATVTSIGECNIVMLAMDYTPSTPHREICACCVHVDPGPVNILIVSG